MTTKRKNPKTNAIAYLIILVFILGMVLVFLGKATLGEVTAFGSATVTLLSAIGFLHASDEKGSTDQ